MELYQYSASQLRRLLAREEVTSEQIVQAYLQHIDVQETNIRSFITITAQEALAHAAESDKRRRTNQSLSAWDGVPIAIKDNISTKGIATTCGSKMLEGYIPPFDATVVDKLKQAGMPLLGKTNMDEFAMGSSTEHSAYHWTRNPLDTRKVPGGSSGGSAAAVTGEEAPWALGSDTGGSVREPAAYCGLVGMKPTYGRVSRYGLVPLASSFDQIGTLTRNVEDSVALTQLIAGHDSRDSTSVVQDVPDFAESLVSHVQGLRIGVPDEYFHTGLQIEIKEAVFAAIRRLEAAGAIMQEVSLPATEVALETYYLIADAEASSNFARYDGVRYGKRIDGDDTVTMFKNTRTTGFGSEVKRRIMLGTYVLSAGHYDEYYKKAQQVRALMRQEFDQAFDQVDLLITPTTATTAFGFGEKADPLQMYLSDIYTVTANLVGIPALSMPCGTDNGGMPIGLQMMGRHFEESTLFRAALALEQLLTGGLNDAESV